MTIECSSTVARSTSPVRNLLMVGSLVFLIEMGIMVLLSRLSPLPDWQNVLLDSALLVVLVFPVLQRFMVRPLVLRISKREQAEKELLQSKSELATRNRIDTVFLTNTDEGLYEGVLHIIRDSLESPLGMFGYIEENGDLVAPSLNPHVWSECRIPDKSVVFRRETWPPSTARALAEKRTIWSNEPPLHIPKGHVPIQRSIASPIVFR